MNARLAVGVPLATLVFATADESRPQPAATAGLHDSAAEQMRHIFHELHADGRNAHCAVCDSQYQTA